MSSDQQFEIGIGKNAKRFTGGLFWQPLARDGQNTKIDIDHIASEQSFDLMVLRTTGLAQVGFGTTLNGMSAGLYSAAAVVSKGMEVLGLSRTALCAIQIDDTRWLYFAQRDAVILPHGDVLGDEATVKTLLFEQMSISDWETIIAPTHWHINEATQYVFEDFLPKKGKGGFDYKSWWKLKPVHRKFVDLKRVLQIALVVGVIAAGIFLYGKWQQHIAQKKMTELQVAKEMLAPKAELKAKPERPWKKMPKALVFANACLNAIKTVPSLYPANWQLRDTVCGDGLLTVVWIKPEAGNLAALLEIIPNAEIAGDGKSATLTLALTLPVGDDETLDSQKVRIQALHNAAQRINLPITIGEITKIPTMPGEVSAVTAVDWLERSWAIPHITIDPLSVIAALDGKGFRVTKITTTFDAGSIKQAMEGIQYVH